MGGCLNCQCMECRTARAIDKAKNMANDMGDNEAPIHRLTWRDAEPANEEQARVWGSIVDRALKDYGRINMPAAIAIVLGECHVRPENYTRVGLQVERFFRESTSFELRKGKNGGVFKSEPDTRGMKPIDALDMVDRKMRASEIQKAIAKKESEHLSYIKLTELAGIPDLITADINPDNYTCKGCGNEKLSTMEKSCWKCGREVGT